MGYWPEMECLMGKEEDAELGLGDPADWERRAPARPGGLTNGLALADQWDNGQKWSA